MRHNQEIVFSLLKLVKAEDALKFGRLSAREENVLREFIDTLKKSVPESALAHIRRIRTESISGVGVVKNCACSVCGATLSDDELSYVRNAPNVGLCENCFSFLVSDYPPDYDIFLDDTLSSVNER